MARLSVNVNKQESARTQFSKPPDLVERRLRRIGAWFLLFLALQAELGLAWDRNWHDFVGRNEFFTPPHIMLYSGIAGSGLIALFVVLVDTYRYYHKKPGVDDNSTVKILHYFHAPLGYIILGFGALIDLLAAPLDNYWHILYGIDVTLWSPFHLMGTVGGIIVGLGIVFVFASEAVIERQSAYPPRRFLGLTGLEWGTLVILSAYMNLTIPADTAFIPVTLGSLQFITYPLPLAFTAAFSLTAAVKFTRKPGSATLAALLLWFETLYTMSFVPVAIRIMVSRLGLHYRFPNLPGRTPVFNVTLALLPLLFLVSALIVDGIAFWKHQHGKDKTDVLSNVWLPGALIALSALVLPPLIIESVMSIPALLPLPVGVSIFEQNWSSTFLTLPLALLTGILGAILGSTFGDFWHSNNR
jgi:hypothetical protein